jgi:hypothetical protein
MCFKERAIITSKNVAVNEIIALDLTPGNKRVEWCLKVQLKVFLFKNILN